MTKKKKPCVLPTQLKWMTKEAAKEYLGMAEDTFLKTVGDLTVSALGRKKTYYLIAEIEEVLDNNIIKRKVA